MDSKYPMFSRGENNMEYSYEIEKIKASLEEQKTVFNDTLILNPVENVPNQDILEPCTSFLHGLYNTDTTRSHSQKIDSKIQFAGRTQITEDITQIYAMWKELMGGEAISMRLLSGLHAHIVLFMSITDIGQKVLALPEKAGGHISSYSILNRLGLKVHDIPYNSAEMKIDRNKCIQEIEDFQPDIIFIDRSEGLLYEDFTWLGQYVTNFPCYKIFDASQYLTNIICHDYISPFEMGFDLILSTMHKNLPGPQRAFVCAKKADKVWERLRSGISTYVSNMHVFSIYSAGLLLKDYEKLKLLSQAMLYNACLLEDELEKRNVPIIKRNTSPEALPTHHCWIGPLDKNRAFCLYATLEKIGILTNYRLLPYDIGYGLRLGLSAATNTGLLSTHIPELAEIIAVTYNSGYSTELAHRCMDFIHRVKGIVNNE